MKKPPGYVKCSGEFWHKQRMRALVRDDFYCQAEKLDLPPCEENRLRFLHIHHILPRINGGNHDLTNLLTLCRACHMKLHPHMRLDLSDGPRDNFDLDMREL